jgi:membrane protein DedA with SNARE-associated domain
MALAGFARAKMTLVFDALLTWLHAMGDATNSPVVLAVLMVAAGIEYIVPPFPGDSVTLLGGILVSAFGWNLALVFSAVMIGSVAGSFVAFAFGKRLLRRQPAIATSDRKLGRIVKQFEKRGSWYLLINRFLPGIRPLFFIAAGLAGMPQRRVLALSAASAALWNAAIMAAGAAVGDNLERLEELLVQYSTGAWIVLFAIALVIGVRAIIRRASSRR